MWSVVLLDRSGSILEVLADSEPVLSGALAFAAGYGNSPSGVVAVVPCECISSAGIDRRPLNRAAEYSAVVSTTSEPTIAPSVSTDRSQARKGGLHLNHWLSRVARNVEFNSLTKVASLCRAIRTYVIDHYVQMGLERESCLDCFEWTLSGEQVDENTDLTSWIDKAKAVSPFSDDFNEWLLQFVTHIPVNSLTVAGMLCRAIRDQAIDAFVRQGLERESCLDSFELMLSGELSNDDRHIHSLWFEIDYRAVPAETGKTAKYRVVVFDRKPFVASGIFNLQQAIQWVETWEGECPAVFFPEWLAYQVQEQESGYCPEVEHSRFSRGGQWNYQNRNSSEFSESSSN